MVDTRLQDAAMLYWRQGYTPMPISPGAKESVGTWKALQTRAPTAPQIRQNWPPGSQRNIALLLGPRKRLLVLNLNMKHGQNGVRTLEREQWRVPPTPTVLTAHDGLAYLFRVPNPERYPYPFNTHQALTSLPGIELRGSGGYQLVPPSAVDANPRDPAGSYHWQEPWTPERLTDDLADLPDWLLTLWITTDRLPPSRSSAHTPQKAGLPRGRQQRLHTVVVSKDATTVCSGDTTTVCSPPSESGLGESGLTALLHHRATMETCARSFGLQLGGRNFVCPLPGHVEAKPSASLYWNDNGDLVFRDWHKRSGKEFWTLSEVYAAVVSGRFPTDEQGLATTLADASMATWSLRLLIEAKCIEPYPVPLPPLPDDALGSVVRLYDGLKLLFGAKWAYAPGQPTMFTRSFAQDWCGVSDKTAWVGTQWLLQRQVIVQAGRHKGRPLYLPGKGE